MPSQRQQRVARRILQAVSTIVEHQVSDPRVGLVTFTHAEVSPDLRNAIVYFAVHGGADQAAASGAALKGASRFIRRELGRELGLRYTPAVRFEHDDAPERADRIERLLAGLGRGSDDDV